MRYAVPSAEPRRTILVWCLRLFSLGLPQWSHRFNLRAVTVRVKRDRVLYSLEKNQTRSESSRICSKVRQSSDARSRGAGRCHARGAIAMGAAFPLPASAQRCHKRGRGRISGFSGPVFSCCFPVFFSRSGFMFGVSRVVGSRRAAKRRPNPQSKRESSSPPGTSGPVIPPCS